MEDVRSTREELVIELGRLLERKQDLRRETDFLNSPVVYIRLESGVMISVKEFQQNAITKALQGVYNGFVEEEYKNVCKRIDELEEQLRVLIVNE